MYTHMHTHMHTEQYREHANIQQHTHRFNITHMIVAMLTAGNEKKAGGMRGGKVEREGRKERLQEGR